MVGIVESLPVYVAAAKFGLNMGDALLSIDAIIMENT